MLIKRKFVSDLHALIKHLWSMDAVPHLPLLLLWYLEFVVRRYPASSCIDDHYLYRTDLGHMFHQVPTNRRTFHLQLWHMFYNTSKHRLPDRLCIVVSTTLYPHTVPCGNSNWVLGLHKLTGQTRKRVTLWYSYFHKIISKLYSFVC